MKFAPLVDTPMFIVTCFDGTEKSGCLVGFATQCSIEPPRFLVCISSENHTYGVASRSATLGVHFLEESNEPLAAHFGEMTGDEVDKFAGIAWEAGVGGAPILTECAVSFEGRICSTVPFGDHEGFVLAPMQEVDAQSALQGEQLSLRDVETLEPGHPVSAGVAEEPAER